MLDVLSDDEDHLAVTGVLCIVNTEIQKCLIVHADSIDLLHSAVAASHTCSQNQKGRFHFLSFSFIQLTQLLNTPIPVRFPFSMLQRKMEK